MKYITSKHVFFDYLNENEFVIGIGSNQEITNNKDYFNNCLNLCYFCINPKSISEILSFIKDNNIDILYFDKMKKMKFITKEIIDFNDRYSRNHLYYNALGYKIYDIQNKISKSHILIVGAGGIGNICSYLLGTIGIKKLSIIDDDIVEESNLNRQFLFREKDINKNKVETIKRELLSIRKDIIIDIFPEKLNKSILDKISQIDLVICSADDEYCIDMINEFCCFNKIPLINVGYLNDISVIGPFYIPKLEYSCCLCCDKSIYLENDVIDEKVKKIKSVTKAPSTIINNFFAGAMLGSELIKFFARDYKSMQSINSVIGIHNKNFKYEEIKLAKNYNCKYCGVNNETL
ncbi:thiamine biosynthesis protein ThiF [Histophilus somni]|uniref:ThiF family adenylyltransferase n=2 Tax=Histophilus somni TaxID=731 RepID=A0A9Q6Z1L0_HISSO|nr:ThiF family adenylyltransferase [Histophilus somni]ARU64042.1 thiamine biosynthesis protein ThiF [Histophilus somni]ARU65823.1 thiamine biosynthesis protein ThiF [Histophilus somni]ARU67697.1 thiamine biosynthesis protein ThiF [Histophilus somni]ARU69577.1 thiamine biosynthesis protein ThiF [Histophilus somni]ARU71454.1 thiamine biosynthesis protein ThiF [Histophilus somni]